jgi:hypothetical protein
MNIDAEVARQAQQRFLRGLVCDSVDEALTSGVRTLEQWNACLDSARVHLRRVDANHRRRRIPTKPDSVACRALRALADAGRPRTAEDLARTLEAHPDVIRRALKKYKSNGVCEAEDTYNRDHPRAFAITPHGMQLLKQLPVMTP